MVTLAVPPVAVAGAIEREMSFTRSAVPVQSAKLVME